MRDNPFLGQYTLKSQEIRKWGEIVMENGKYGQERYDGSLREFLVANPFPRKTTLLGHNANHQGEAEKKA
jgi:hypothetical protein